MKTRRIQVALWIVIGASAVIAFVAKPELAAFEDVSSQGILKLLTPLFLIALFMERALEVFVTAWRGPDSTDMARQIEKLEADVARGGRGATQKAAQLEDARDKLSAFKSETQRIAFLSSLALGVVISAVGVRSLQWLLIDNVTDGFTGLQIAFFRLIDVLITGALLGGGSEGIHKLMNVFTNFLDSTAQRAKGQGPSGHSS